MLSLSFDRLVYPYGVRSNTMTKYIINLALLLAARNVQSILDFFTALDTKLDKFIANRDIEIERINKDIAKLTDNRLGVEKAKEVAARLKDGVTGLIA